MKCLAFALVLLLSVTEPSNGALRQLGEPYVGLQHLNTRPYKSYRLSPPIIGGEQVENDNAPWQVSLQNRHGNHFCGGAIIDDNWVLTAANCVAGLRPLDVHVITSTNNWMNDDSSYGVEQLITHCNFDKPLYYNDIALIKLDRSITYDSKTQNITLAQENELKENDVLEMTGWGSWELGKDYPEPLKKLKARYLPHDQCLTSVDTADNVDIGHLCVLSNVGEGACHGDAGGPLVNTKQQLMGIGNWGKPCGTGAPDVFASVPFYSDWIRTTIKGCTIKK